MPFTKKLVKRVDDGSGDNFILFDNGSLEFAQAVVVLNDDGLPITVDNDIDASNSTTTPLGISGVFTGTGTDVSMFGMVTVTLFSDQDSAFDGISIEFSTDNANWDDKTAFNLTGGIARKFQVPVTSQYYRLVFTNGTTGQSAFRVQTVLHSDFVQKSLHRLGDDVIPDRSTLLTKTAIIAQASGSGNFVPVQATASGNLKVGIEDINGVVMPTAGDVAHDAADSGFPLKIGGYAASAAPTAVAIGDRVNAWFDLNGRLQVTGVTTGSLGGDTAHDAVDTGDPLKIGGKANTGTPATVQNLDRVDAWFDGLGRQVTKAYLITSAGSIVTGTGNSLDTAAQGDVAHDAADTGNPLKMGGKASSSQPAAVANADRVEAYFDVNGYQQIRAHGNVAHDGADSGAPIKTGGYAQGATEIVPVAAGDRVNALHDTVGRQIASPHGNRTDENHATVNCTTTADTTLLAAGGANIFLDVVALSIHNMSSSLTTVIEIKDAAAGTVQFKLKLKPEWGAVINLPMPLSQSAANNAWVCALGATGDVQINIMARATRG